MKVAIVDVDVVVVITAAVCCYYCVLLRMILLSGEIPPNRCIYRYVMYFDWLKIRLIFIG